MEREYKKNGDYREERKCESSRRRYPSEYKQEYWEGNCKIEREQKANGDYKEERKCKSDEEENEPVVVTPAREPEVIVVEPQP